MSLLFIQTYLTERPIPNYTHMLPCKSKNLIFVIFISADKVNCLKLNCFVIVLNVRSSSEDADLTFFKKRAAEIY